jgi:hypothetical protein
MRRLNDDQSSNIALAAMIAIEVMEKITGQKLPPDAKITILEILIGIALWFTGKPSSLTESLAAQVRRMFGAADTTNSNATTAPTPPLSVAPESSQFAEFSRALRQSPVRPAPESRIPFPTRDPDDIQTEF